MITGSSDLVDLTDVTVEADTRCHEVDDPARPVGVRVGERVRDAWRCGPKVARTELDDLVAKLDAQCAIENIERVFLRRVEM